MPRPSCTLEIQDIRMALHRLFIEAPGTSLRIEDEKKCVELLALLTEVARLPRSVTLVDAAAGKSALGLLAGLLLGFERIVVLERDADRVEACRKAARHLPSTCHCDIQLVDVRERRAWPPRPGAVLGLHACGPASDAIIDGAIAASAKQLLLVPCCYSNTLPHAARARAMAQDLGLARHGALRSQLVSALIDTERVLRLEAAGYEVEAVRFVPTSTTPHNLLLRARLTAEPQAMEIATARRRAWLGEGI